MTSSTDRISEMFPAKSVPFIDIEYLDPSLRLFRLIMEEISLLPLFFSLSDSSTSIVSLEINVNNPELISSDKLQPKSNLLINAPVVG